jgi:hypothetical protein
MTNQFTLSELTVGEMVSDAEQWPSYASRTFGNWSRQRRRATYQPRYCNTPGAVLGEVLPPKTTCGHTGQAIAVCTCPCCLRAMQRLYAIIFPLPLHEAIEAANAATEADTLALVRERLEVVGTGEGVEV